MAAALCSIEVEPRPHFDYTVGRHPQMAGRIQFVFAQQNKQINSKRLPKFRPVRAVSDSREVKRRSHGVIRLSPGFVQGLPEQHGHVERFQIAVASHDPDEALIEALYVKAFFRRYARKSSVSKVSRITCS